MARWQGCVAGLLALTAPLVSHAAEQTLEGRHSYLAGMRSFESATGAGGFTGARIDHLDTSGDTRHRGGLTLTLPE